MADAGKVYRAAEEVAEARKHDPIDRFVAQQSIDAETVDAPAQRGQRRDRRRHPPGGRRSRRPIPANLYDNVYGDPDWREQFAPMARGGPFGEREGTRSWRA